MVVALWGRDELAADSGVDDTGGWGGVTLAHNVSSPRPSTRSSRRPAPRARGSPRDPPRPSGAATPACYRSGRAPVGGRPQPVLDARRGRLDLASASERRILGHAAPAQARDRRGRDVRSRRCAGRSGALLDPCPTGRTRSPRPRRRTSCSPSSPHGRRSSGTRAPRPGDLPRPGALGRLAEARVEGTDRHHGGRRPRGRPAARARRRQGRGDRRDVVGAQARLAPRASGRADLRSPDGAARPRAKRRRRHADHPRLRQLRRIGSAPAFFGRGRAATTRWGSSTRPGSSGSARSTPRTPTAAAGARRHRRVARDQGERRPHQVVIATKTFNPMSEGADRGLARDRGSCRRWRRASHGSASTGSRSTSRTTSTRTCRRRRRFSRSTSWSAPGRSARPAPRTSRGAARRGARALALEGLTRYEWVQNAFSLLEQRDRETVFPSATSTGSASRRSARSRAVAHREVPPRRGAAARPRMTMRPEGPSTTGRTTFDALEAFEREAADRGVSMAALAIAWLLDVPSSPRSSWGRTTSSSCARARGARRPVVPAADQERIGGCSRERRARPVRRRRPRAARHGVVHRRDGGGPWRARSRRADDAAAVRRPLARRAAHGSHAGAPRWRRAALLAQGDRGSRRRTRAGSIRTRARSCSTTARRASCARSSTRRRSPRSGPQPSPPSPPSCSPARLRRVAILGAGVRRGRTRRRCARSWPTPSCGSGAARRRTPRRSRSEVARRRLRHDRGGARRRRRRLHLHVVARADRAPRLARSRDARERRGLVRPVGARARDRRRRRGRAVRRPARVDAERVRATTSARWRRRASARSTSAPSWASSWSARHPGRRGPDELTVFKSLGLAVEDLAAAALCVERARSAGSAPRWSSDPARRDRAGARDHRRHRLAEPRHPPRRRRAVRDLAQARVPAPDRLVQAPRRDERDPAGGAGGVAQRRLDDERGEHGAGRLLGRAAARRARDRRRARPPHARSSMRSSASAGGSSPCRSTPGGRRWRPARTRASTGCSSTRARRAGDGRETASSGWSSPSSSASSTRCSCRGAAADCRRDRERARGGLAGNAQVVACEPATGAPLAASFAAGRGVDVDYTPSFVDGAGSKAVLPAMWERARALLAGAVAVPLDDVAAAVRLLATRGASSPREPARSRSPPPSPATAARVGSSASCRGGTSTPSCSRRSSSQANRASATASGSAVATDRLGDGEVHPLERKRIASRHQGSSTSTCTTRARRHSARTPGRGGRSCSSARRRPPCPSRGCARPSRSPGARRRS